MPYIIIFLTDSECVFRVVLVLEVAGAVSLAVLVLVLVRLVLVAIAVAEGQGAAAALARGLGMQIPMPIMSCLRLPEAALGPWMGPACCSFWIWRSCLWSCCFICWWLKTRGFAGGAVRFLRLSVMVALTRTSGYRSSD